MLKIKKSNLEKIFAFLFSLLIYRKFGGAVPIPVVAILLTTLMLSLLYVNRLYKKNFFIAEYLVLLIIFSMFIGLLYSGNSDYGLSKFLTCLLTSIGLFLVRRVIIANTQSLCFFILLLILIYAIEIYQIYGPISSLLIDVGVRFRLGWDEDGNSLQASPIAISRFICIGLICLWYLSQKLENSGSNYKLLLSIVCILVLPVSVFLLFLSGTKSPILALLLSYALVNIRSLHRVISIRLSKIVLVFGFCIFITFLSSLDSSIQEFITYRYLDFGGAISDREMQLLRALSRIDISILLFGVGTGDFGLYVTGLAIRDYPHNIFLELLFENGLLASVCLAIIFIYALILSYSATSLEIKFYCCLLIFFTITSMFSGDLISNAIIFPLATFMNKGLFKDA